MKMKKNNEDFVREFMNKGKKIRLHFKIDDEGNPEMIVEMEGKD